MNGWRSRSWPTPILAWPRHLRFSRGARLATGKGNTVVFAITNATDQTAIATHVGVAQVTNPYDYNKDGFVNSTDEAVAGTNSDFLQYIKILPARAGSSNRGRRQPVLRRFEIQ